MLRFFKKLSFTALGLGVAAMGAVDANACGGAGGFGGGYSRAYSSPSYYSAPTRSPIVLTGPPVSRPFNAQQAAPNGQGNFDGGFQGAPANEFQGQGVVNNGPNQALLNAGGQQFQGQRQGQPQGQQVQQFQGQQVQGQQVQGQGQQFQGQQQPQARQVQAQGQQFQGQQVQGQGQQQVQGQPQGQGAQQFQGQPQGQGQQQAQQFQGQQGQAPQGQVQQGQRQQLQGQPQGPVNPNATALRTNGAAVNNVAARQANLNGNVAPRANLASNPNVQAAPQQQIAAPVNQGPVNNGPMTDAQDMALQALGGEEPAVQSNVATSSSGGDFVANVGNGASIRLSLTDGGAFTWTATNNGKSSSFQGSFAIENGKLTLTRSQDNQKMDGDFTQTQDGFSFKMSGAKDNGLNFVRG